MIIYENRAVRTSSTIKYCLGTSLRLASENQTTYHNKVPITTIGLLGVVASASRRCSKELRASQALTALRTLLTVALPPNPRGASKNLLSVPQRSLHCGSAKASSIELLWKASFVKDQRGGLTGDCILGCSESITLRSPESTQGWCELLWQVCAKPIVQNLCHAPGEVSPEGLAPALPRATYPGLELGIRGGRGAWRRLRCAQVGSLMLPSYGSRLECGRPLNNR